MWHLKAATSESLHSLRLTQARVDGILSAHCEDAGPRAPGGSGTHASGREVPSPSFPLEHEALHPHVEWKECRSTRAYVSPKLCKLSEVAVFRCHHL